MFLQFSRKTATFNKLITLRNMKSFLRSLTARATRATIVILALLAGLVSCANSPKEYEVEVRQMDCTSADGLKIWGQLYMPEGARGKLPVAILAHGFNSSRNEVSDYAERLAQRGIASYVFEFCGGSTNSLSEGETTDMTIFTESGNVLSIVAMIKGEKWADTKRMALLGCSQGGLVTATTTGANPDLFKAQVLIYPALGIPDSAPRMLAQFEASGEDSMNVMNLKIGRCYYEAINGFSVFENMPAFKGSTLIVYGNKDGVTPEASMQRAEQTVGGPCKVVMIPDATHGFPVPEHHAVCADAVVNFLVEVL